ncbi:hypothetical protein G7Z17_g5143 [Cylindrodendrum hubeiense]|uniref:SCP domain-containing protein n=1 Tax=Cylindrodendrum hubeiense TaxID=595255 RepID=A0A9P5L9B9_9HYPO|nr:hypothetical protein G7Z17_g5143 [Cylindrodendrum hubeiense]
MLFSTVSARLLLLGVPSVVMGGLIPFFNRDVRSDSTPSDLTVITGEPEFILLGSKRSQSAEELLERDLTIEPRALTADQTESLRLHNVARAKKKVKALRWSPTLQKNALVWAKKLAKLGKLEHSVYGERINQGENLAYSWSTATIKNPIVIGTKGWLAEITEYHNETIPKGDFSAYGHYTQCMWNTTTLVGIATVSNGKGAWYTVARYSKPGNIGGLRPY